MRGSSGGSSHENLELVLAKSLTRKEERVESRSKGAEKKILIPPILRRGPISPVSCGLFVSKVVLHRLDSTSTKELEGGYLQAVGSDTNL